VILDVPMETRRKQHHCYNCGHVVRAHPGRRRCALPDCPCTHYWGTDQEAFGNGNGMYGRKTPRELR